jgi:hypothetical protein
MTSRRLANGARAIALVSGPRIAVSVMAAVLLSGCRAETRPPREAQPRFHNVGAWSGRGNAQTGSFTSDTGGFRVQWEAKNESRPGAGRLQVTFHSGDSGRPIMEAVDSNGVGRGDAYVSDRVRWYYLVVESADVEWSVSVDEDLGERPAGAAP